jgi:hypothetical protein
MLPLAAVLCVGVASFNFPQDGLRGKLPFAVALLLYARFGVGYAFFSTRATWLHVETAAVWM